jgi:hypothetical protein
MNRTMLDRLTVVAKIRGVFSFPLCSDFRNHHRFFKPDANRIWVRCETIMRRVRKLFRNARYYGRVTYCTSLRSLTTSNFRYIDKKRCAGLYLNTKRGTLSWTTSTAEASVRGSRLWPAHLCTTPPGQRCIVSPYERTVFDEVPFPKDTVRRS